MKPIAIAILLTLSAGGMFMTQAKDRNAPDPDLVSNPIEYMDGDTVLEGFLALKTEPVHRLRPGVIVVHEWTGLNDHSKERARMLADLGYIALAADIYGKGIRAKNNEEAAKLAGTYRNQDRRLLRQRMRAALECLRNQPGVDPKRIGAIGFCFGGSAVLELARDGADVKGVVSFHGGLSGPVPA